MTRRRKAAGTKRSTTRSSRTSDASPKSRKKKDDIVRSDHEDEEDMPASEGEEEENVSSKKSKSKKASVGAATPSYSQLSSSLFSQSQLQHDEEVSLEEFLNSDYISSKLKTEELREHLKRVSEVLSKVQQITKDEEPWSGSFLSDLAERRIMSTKDKASRVYIALCFAEILRITAPDAPFNFSELKRIFRLFLEELKQIVEMDDPLYTYRFKLLEKLATVRSFILLTDPEMKADDIIEDVFDCFFTAAREQEKLSHRTIIYMGEIMSSILEHLDTYGKEMLGLLLKQLIRTSDEEPPYFVLARQVFDKSADQIVSPLTDYLNEKLSHLSSIKSNEKYEKARAILFKQIQELNLISTRLLLYVMPTIATELRDPDVKIRSGVVQLLGDMFCSKDSTLSLEYKHLFEEYLGRCADVDPRIRIYMAKFLANMLMNHHSSQQEVNSKIEERIMDSEEKVRRNIVESICTVATHYPQLISEKIMKLMGDRCRDKKPKLRLHTIQLLAQLYNHHSLTVLRGHHEVWPDELLAKFGWIPSKILDIYAERSLDSEHRLFIETVIDETLLPDALELRTISITDMYSRFKDPERKAIIKLLQHKSFYQASLKAFVEYQPPEEVEMDIMEEEEQEISEEGSTENTSKKSDKQKVVDGKLNEIISKVSLLLPDSDVGKKVWRELYNNRNGSSKKTMQLLRDVLDVNRTFQDIINDKKKLEKCSESEQVKKYLHHAIQRASMSFICKEQLELIMSYSYKAIQRDDINKCMYHLELLETIARFYPTIFSECFDFMFKLIKEDDVQIIEITLKILHFTCKDLGADDADLAECIESRLLELAEKGSYISAKYSVRSLYKMFASTDNIIKKLFTRLCTKLEYNQFLISIFSSIRVIALNSPSIFDSEAVKVVNFVMDEIIQKDRKDSSVKFSEPSLECKIKCAAIKLLGSTVHAKSILGVGPENEQVIKRIETLLKHAIRNKGRLSDQEETVAESRVMETDEEGSEENQDEKKKNNETKGTKSSINEGHCRLAAAKQLLTLLTIDECRMHFSLDDFLELAWVSLDDHPEVRFGFAKKLTKETSTLRLHLKYVAMLLLCVADPVASNAFHARNNFTLVIQALRNVIKQARDITLDSKVAVRFYPEYILPYLIYVTSHHPGFESLAPDYLIFQRIYFAYFDEVTKGADNLTFFYQLIARIKQRKDVHNPDSNNSRKMCDLCMAVLGKCAEGKSFSTQSFPGAIYIPSFFGMDHSLIPSSPGSNAINPVMKPYLEDFKLHDKIARKFVSETSSRFKSKDAKSPGRKRTRTKKTTVHHSPKKKTSKSADESISPRRKLSRNAKKGVDYAEIEGVASHSASDQDDDDDDDGVAEEREQENSDPDVEEEKSIPQETLSSRKKRKRQRV